MKTDLPPKVIAAMLGRYRDDFEAGDGDALIEAIKFCFAAEVVAPGWVRDAFCHATKDWDLMHTKERGSAFGPGPKGKHAAATRKRRRFKLAVYNAMDSKEPGVPIDNELFEQIGKRLGLGSTLVKKIWRDAREEFEGLTPQQRRKK